MGKICFLFLFFFIFSTCFGQITTNAVYSDTTRYKVFTPNSKLFVFPNTITANITAQSRDTLIEKHTYTWTRYVKADTNFTDTIKIDADTNASALSGIPQGCYKVNITDSIGKDSAYTMWVFYDSISFRIDSTGSTCTNFSFRLNNVKLDTVWYFDLKTQDSIKVANQPTIKWKYAGLKEPYETNYYPFSTTEPTPNPGPPVDTTTYYATLTNSYNNSHTETYKVWKPLATKADFIFDTKDETYGKQYAQFKGDSNNVTPKGGAPLPVTLINKSKNGETFEWYFFAYFHKHDEITFDTTIPYKPDPIKHLSVKAPNGTRSDPKDTAHCTFYYPGYYTIKLVSRNSTCDTNSFSYRSPDAKDNNVYSLEVNKPVDFTNVDIPRSFQPDGENVERNFRFNLSDSSKSINQSQWFISQASIKDLHLKIFDRWGRIVYEFNGAMEWPDNQEGGWDAWEGWNGKYNNKGSECVSGIYFYVIELKTWNDQLWKDELKRNAAATNNKSGNNTTNSSTSSNQGLSNVNPSATNTDFSQSKAKWRPQGIHTGFVYLIR